LAREKIKRKLDFRPTVKRFSPIGKEPLGSLKLLHEEIEAIYLSDVLELYQDEAASRMEVSRPTYRRILKSARSKIAQSLITGYALEIENLSHGYVVAVCKEQHDSYENISPYGVYIDIFKVDSEGEIESYKGMKREMSENQPYKPALVLPKLFVEQGVNYFITSKIGEGLKSALMTKGIEVIVQKEFKKEDISSLF